MIFRKKVTDREKCKAITNIAFASIFEDYESLTVTVNGDFICVTANYKGGHFHESSYRDKGDAAKILREIKE